MAQRPACIDPRTVPLGSDDDLRARRATNSTRACRTCPDRAGYNIIVLVARPGNKNLVTLALILVAVLIELQQTVAPKNNTTHKSRRVSLSNLAQKNPAHPADARISRFGWVSLYARSPGI